MTGRPTTGEPVLEVRNLVTEFPLRTGPFRAVDGVSFELHAGRTLCVVGESGSGKSVTARSILQIVDTPGRDDPLVAHFEARQTPLVSVGTVPGRPDIPAVDLRSRATATMLLDHLRDRGSRRVATVIGGSTRTSQTETDEAYHAFAIRSGTEPILIALDEEGGEELAYRRSLDLLGDHPEIDGLYVSIDAFASGAVRAARDLGRAIPGNLRIATRYDGLRAKLSEPPLTAVDLHLPEIADAAVELLRRRIEGGGGQTEAALPMLVPRASTN